MTDPTATLPTAPPAVAAVTLSLVEVTRGFAGRRVLGPITLALDVGALAVVHGPNGAGKTTLLRVAAGLLTPTAGSCTCAGRAVYLRPGAGARHTLTVRQALGHTAALTGTSTAVVAEACHLAGLTGAMSERRVGELSAGQHARLSVALAVVADSALVCLDEPTAHLDRDGVEHVRAAVRALTARGTSVLLASHTPAQFRDLADATLTIHDGLLRESSW